jgi:hypothetical protein
MRTRRLCGVLATTAAVLAGLTTATPQPVRSPDATPSATTVTVYGRDGSAAADRFVTLSLLRIRVTWMQTVLSLMCRRWAICRFVHPVASNPRTSISRMVGPRLAARL